jgi:hypothetical protein
MSKYAEHLGRELFTDTIEQAPTRKGFGEELVLAGDQDPRVVALCADLTESTQMEAFAESIQSVPSRLGSPSKTWRLSALA